MDQEPEHDLEERSPSGSPIYRHKPRPNTGELATGATPYLRHIGDHIQRHVGHSPMVFHELVSTDVHIDLHVVPPSASKVGNHFTVITSGVSSRPMKVPPGSGVCPYVELMIALPADWPGMNSDGTFDPHLMKDERNWWPMRWLKNVARLPHQYDSFLAQGHTIPNGEDAEPFAAGTGFGCMLLLKPLLWPKPAWELRVDDATRIRFFALWPLYRQEMRLKLAQGLGPLLDRLGGAGVDERIDVGRPDTCADFFG